MMATMGRSRSPSAQKLGKTGEKLKNWVKNWGQTGRYPIIYPCVVRVPFVFLRAVLYYEALKIAAMAILTESENNPR